MVLVNIEAHISSTFNTLCWLRRYLSGEQNVLKDNVVFRIHLFMLLLKQKHGTLVRSCWEAARVTFILRADVPETWNCVE